MSEKAMLTHHVGRHFILIYTQNRVNLQLWCMIGMGLFLSLFCEIRMRQGDDS